MSATSFAVACVLLLCLLIAPAAAFGAGDITHSEGLDGHLWRHGDIATAVLLNLPISFKTKHRFSELEKRTVYFGNWLRDFSQIVDVTALKVMPEPLLRAMVSVLAFMHFGFATGEFDVTQKRLGCYTHVEHIDNPSGYQNNAKEYDNRLRGPVDPKELEIDPETGMKNYIANSGKGWDTSARYIQDQLRMCVDKGRRGQSDRRLMMDALIHLGGALHTLEDFAAHSNFVELCLNKLGEEDVFAVVGDGCRVQVPSTNQQVPPLVTGTFGMLDVYQSILGEADDKATLSCGSALGELGELSNNLNIGEATFDALYNMVKSAVQVLSKISDLGNDMVDELDKVLNIVKEAERDPSAFQTKEQKEKNNIDDNPSALWQALEPAFALHDRIARWLLESESSVDLNVPWLSEAMDNIHKYIDEFVYQYLSRFIQPAIQEMRKAVAAGREQILADEQKLDKEKDIYTDGSINSDPSHSIIAKDHFSNCLNPAAGLVATVTTNWATQQVVRCWDDSEIDCDFVIDEILKTLHHPQFVEEQTATFIQRAMFGAVKGWWAAHTDDEKAKLRSILTKSAVRENLNNHRFTATHFHGKRKGPAVFEGSVPDAIDRPKQEADVSEILCQLAGTVGEGIGTAAEAVMDQTIKSVGDVVEEEWSDTGHGASTLMNKAKGAVSDIIDTVPRGFVQGDEGAAGTTGETAAAAGNSLAQVVADAVGYIGDTASATLGVVNKAMPWNWYE